MSKKSTNTSIWSMNFTSGYHGRKDVEVEISYRFYQTHHDLNFDWDTAKPG